MGPENKSYAGLMTGMGVATVLLLDWLQVIQLHWRYLWPAFLLLGGVAMIRWATGPTRDGGR